MKAQRCPACGRPVQRKRIPDAPAKLQRQVAPVKEYAIERKYGVRRVKGEFV